ncbi:alkaline phosphatase family protein [Algoriphagus hitonicola]|uniref:Type I phosphodiesterase / nucleotide pyrophosphatase n=1 Tax=Algoriphagus hitonicola TaxID=435880 RepID=A0A1I2XL25_9BACT|nr:alkaline phosphatase family protein [Algoriphagus hitonicola]SFH13396.1 Type I phosphodiesterase / nucleotide pyrophosphatase [Algoriphagus hitonicola]
MKNLILIAVFLIGINGICFGQKEQEKKVLFIILDGISADNLERVNTPHLDEIAQVGGYCRAYTGGVVGTYSETPTISAVGYNSLLTGTWANKHQVYGNSIRNPNYHYWTVFRYLKEARPEAKLGIFSTWLDNRTKLIGESLPQTGNLKFDYSFDGFELDTLMFPHDQERRFILNIDNYVSFQAAHTVREKGPDLSWVYLEYTDDMGHRFGDSPQTDLAIQYADWQVGRIWDAIQYRQRNFAEDWMVLVTTDHGRNEKDGKGHGGQTDRERGIWMVTNLKELNSHFHSGSAAMVDIAPTILRFLNVSIPVDHQLEMDGVPLIGPLSFANVKLSMEGNDTWVTWKPYSKVEKLKIGYTEKDEFEKSGMGDPINWMTDIEVSNGKFLIPKEVSSQSFLKLVLKGEHNMGNTWKANSK